MHILVTDRLACSRCGPAFGLVLLADRLENRRVLSGHLGCANCRERYPIIEGFGDLRPLSVRSNEPHSPDEPLASDDPEEALRRSNRKFSTRFQAIERGVAAAGRTMEQASLAEMEEHYQRAKRNEGKAESGEPKADG